MISPLNWRRTMAIIMVVGALNVDNVSQADS
jgi:hypothetical protein